MESKIIGEVLLANGCTQSQIAALDGVLEVIEKYCGTVHLSIVGFRAMAHCGKVEAKDADAAHWISGELLHAIQEQRNSLAGLVGTRAESEDGTLRAASLASILQEVKSALVSGKPPPEIKI